MSNLYSYDKHESETRKQQIAGKHINIRQISKLTLDLPAILMQACFV